MRTLRSITLLTLSLLLLIAVGCDNGNKNSTADAHDTIDPDEGHEGHEDIEDSEEPPVSPPVQVATWNLRQFPLSSSTITHVAATVQNLGLDIVAFQEIQEPAEYDALLEALPDYDSVLYLGPYDEWNYIGIIWHTAMLSLRDSGQILTSETYALPRAPVQAEFELYDGTTFIMDFTVIALHLKAGTDPADEATRTEAMILIADYVVDLIEGPEDNDVLLVGDFNEAPTDPHAATVFAPFKSRSQFFRILTWDLPVPEDATYLPGGVVLDHMISTTDIDDEIGENQPFVPHLEETISRYRTTVSDHRPVVIQLF